MSDNSKIPWTDATWNPVVGYSKVSEGCQGCYAIREAWRLAHNPKMGIVGSDESVPAELRNPYAPLVKKNGSVLNWTTELHLFEKRLSLPLTWRRPLRVFVNSLNDLFHEAMPEAHIDRVFGVMPHCPHHTFQVLTKRPKRMRDYSKRAAKIRPATWPLPNAHLGVSVENEEAASDRIPALLATPAAIRWISYEPALGPVDWERWLPGIDWLVVGGESGPGSRPMQIEWARAARDACAKAGVPFHFKQHGDWISDGNGGMKRVGKKAAGRLLDGKTHDEFPPNK